MICGRILIIPRIFNAKLETYQKEEVDRKTNKSEKQKKWNDIKEIVVGGTFTWYKKREREREGKFISLFYLLILLSDTYHRICEDML